MTGTVLQPFGPLIARLNTGALDGVFPQGVPNRQYCFWQYRSAAMTASINIAETVTNKSVVSTLVIPHGTSSDLEGIVDNNYIAGSEPNLFRPSGAIGQDALRAVWDYRFSQTTESGGLPLGFAFNFAMLKGLGWAGMGDFSMQFKISGVLSPVDSTFPFSTRPQDFNNPVPTDIVGSIGGNDIINGTSYLYENITFYEEDGTGSGLNGAIDLNVTTFFGWTNREPPYIPTYNTATGGPA